MLAGLALKQGKKTTAILALHGRRTQDIEDRGRQVDHLDQGGFGPRLQPWVSDDHGHTDHFLPHHVLLEAAMVIQKMTVVANVDDECGVVEPKFLESV